MVGGGMSKVDHKYSFPECARKKNESKEVKKGHVVVNGGIGVGYGSPSRHRRRCDAVCRSRMGGWGGGAALT